MKVLIVGAGGREHALAWKCASGRARHRSAGGARQRRHGRRAEGAQRRRRGRGQRRAACAWQPPSTSTSPSSDPRDRWSAASWTRSPRAGLRCFGPQRAPRAARGLQGLHQGVPAPACAFPTARSATFTAASFDAAGCSAQRAPLVVKASGLAAGKGVVIAASVDGGARRARRPMFAGQFGAAGQRGRGRGVSRRARKRASSSWPTAHTSCRSRARRITSASSDGDRGPNTGGMGAYSPAPVVTPALHARIMREVIEPAVRGLAAEGMPYTGFLYAGIMVAPDGTPNVLEFNCRLGDPETQPVLMRLAIRPDAAVRGGARRPPGRRARRTGTRAPHSASSWPQPDTRSARARVT